MEFWVHKTSWETVWVHYYLNESLHNILNLVTNWTWIDRKYTAPCYVSPPVNRRLISLPRRIKTALQSPLKWASLDWEAKCANIKTKSPVPGGRLKLNEHGTKKTKTKVKLTHSVWLQQIQEQIQFFHNIILLPSALRTRAKQHLLPSASFGRAQQSRWWGWRTEGCTCWAALSDNTANSTDRLFRDWRSVPQVLWEEAKEGIVEASDPSVLSENSVITEPDCNMVASELPNSFQTNNRDDTGFGALLTFVFSVQNLCILQEDFNFIPSIMKYLSSRPNMRRSVAFSLERSAILSALSRSFWKLLWIFLISSLLVENWAWMSAGRYSYKTEPINIEIDVFNPGYSLGGKVQLCKNLKRPLRSY